MYQYKDQVGNVRLTYQDADKNGVIDPTEILDESNYYPFGLKHGYYNQLANNFSNSLLPNSHFNGQPDLIDLDANLSLMDFRMYDSTLGRFFGIDLLADSFADQSPYHFGYNNPLIYMDPTGLAPNGEILEDGSELMEDMIIETYAPSWRPEPIDYPTFEYKIIAPPHSGGGGGSGNGSSITNNSKKSVFYKPENTSEKLEIKPGETISDLVDGIRVDNVVIKITDGYSKIIINSDRSVDVFYKNPFKFLYYKVIGGQLYKSPDVGWDNLFKYNK